MAGNDKPVCKYGSSCYRKNPNHFKQYLHPEDAEHKKTKREMSFNEEEKNSDEDAGLPPEKRQKMSDTVSEEKAETYDDEQCEMENSEGVINEESVDVKERICKKFLVKMTDDFYQFWDFCVEFSPTDTLGVLKPVDLELTGPFDELAGRLRGKTWQECILHGRHFYDTPEFLTVLTGKDGFHIGYFRDDPKSTDCFMVANTVSSGCVITPVGLNIFSAVKHQIHKKLTNKSVSSEIKKRLQELDDALTKRANELNLNLKDMKPAKRKIVAKCFHQIGISVPVDETLDVGYRPLTMNNRELRKLLDKIASCEDKASRDKASEPLQEMITFVQFANDECDYGMGLELGIDLFCHGDQFHDYALRLLPLAYDLLGRQEFGTIISRHLKNRQMILPPLNENKK